MDVPQMSVLPEILVVTSDSPAESPVTLLQDGCAPDVGGSGDTRGHLGQSGKEPGMDVPQMSVVPEILVVTSDSPAESPGEEAAMVLCAI
ncbi:hypothetical protein J6590_044617 [Homalodisca vitripennis]|nr:hypothetical protein J6590_044617 [Homalodisca vitripennis]